MTVDYFGDYFTEKGFEFNRLINDDLMQPVRILFQNKHYVSSIKLLMVAIDSVGYVEFGDTVRNPFTAWMDRYWNGDPLGITVEEVWEHRNALLHMSSLQSRKVRAGLARTLVGYLGQIPDGVTLPSDQGTGYYDMQAFILSVAKALNAWIVTYDSDRSKICDFVERYDRIASDARLLHTKISA